MKLRIVLVEPHESGNIGAAARAMKNFGFSDLVIAGRRRDRTDPYSEWWASGAHDIVENARHVETMQEAVADCHMTVATTAARTREIYEELTPAAVAETAAAMLGEDHTLAIVFGREEFGLRQSEIALCQRTASIPTSPTFPTMNLAQSVAIFCYEMAKDLRPARGTSDLATAHLLHLVEERSRDLLEYVGFLRETNPGRVFEEVLMLAGRSGLTRREASLLLAMIRQIDWKLGRGGRKAKGERKSEG